MFDVRLETERVGGGGGGEVLGVILIVSENTEFLDKTPFNFLRSIASVCA